MLGSPGLRGGGHCEVCHDSSPGKPADDASNPTMWKGGCCWAAPGRTARRAIAGFWGSEAVGPVDSTNQC